MTLRSVSLWFLLVVWCDVGLGQSPRLDPGSRVRLRTQGRPARFDGIVLSATAETLTIANRSDHSRDIVSVPVRSIRSVSVWTGRSSAWRRGGEIGAFAGFVSAGALYAARHRRCVGWACGRSSEWIAWSGVGTMAGATVGGMIGALLKKDVWRGISVARLRSHLDPVTGRIVIGLSGSF